MSVVRWRPAAQKVEKQERINTMTLRKPFISPRVLQTCEVELELNLLGASANEVQFISNGIETKGHEVVTGGNTASDASWQVTSGDYFD